MLIKCNSLTVTEEGGSTCRSANNDGSDNDDHFDGDDDDNNVGDGN